MRDRWRQNGLSCWQHGCMAKKRSADAWVTHAQKFDHARRVLLHETAIAAVAFLACVLAAAVISEAVRPPFPAAVPMMDWPPGSI